MAGLRSLAHQPFALLRSAQTISRLGEAVYRLALAWWVLEKTGSVAAVAALAAVDRPEVWHVHLASTVFVLVEAFFHPADSAAAPQITPAKALPSGNSLTSLGSQLAGVVGPALGAGVFSILPYGD